MENNEPTVGDYVEMIPYGGYTRHKGCIGRLVKMDDVSSYDYEIRFTRHCSECKEYMDSYYIADVSRFKRLNNDRLYKVIYGE